eukprot:6173889-Pleurochrysis_carterae.AAC.1
MNHHCKFGCSGGTSSHFPVYSDIKKRAAEHRRQPKCDVPCNAWLARADAKEAPLRQSHAEKQSVQLTDTGGLRVRRAALKPPCQMQRCYDTLCQTVRSASANCLLCPSA